jgi:hypothetical protein
MVHSRINYNVIARGPLSSCMSFMNPISRSLQYLKLGESTLPDRVEPNIGDEVWGVNERRFHHRILPRSRKTLTIMDISSPYDRVAIYTRVEKALAVGITRFELR